MSAQQIVALVARLFAVWLGIGVFNQFALFSLAPSDTAFGAAAYIVPLVTAVPALLLWFFPLAIANKLVPRTGHDNVIRLPAASVAALATAALGLLTIVQALPDTVGVVHNMAGGSRLAGADVLLVLVPFLRLAIGLYLVNKPWFIADRLVPDTALQK